MVEELLVAGEQLVAEEQLMLGARGPATPGGGARSDGDSEWKWERSKPTTTSPLTTFSGNLPGPRGIAVGVTDPLTCFHLFLSHELYNILTQTNLYAQQQRAAKNDTSPWKPVTKDELMAFIGMNI